MRRSFTLLASTILLAPAVASTQWIPSLVEDAGIPDRGTLRVGVSAQLGSFDRRFSRAGDGTREPLGADFMHAAFGAQQMPWLRGTEETIAELAELPAFSLSFGALGLQLRGRVERLPITAELGVLQRLAVWTTVPLVRTRTTVGILPDMGAGATVGVNPALLHTPAFNQDTMLVNAFARASAQLRARIEQCAAGNGPSCEEINRDRAAAEAFATDAERFTTNLSAVYLAGAAVPVAASAADQAIAARIAAMRAQFETYNVTALAGAPARPVAAAPLAYSELQQFVTHPAFGIMGDSLATVERVGLGDVEVGAKLLLFDGTARDDANPAPPVSLRAAVGGLVRFGTGNPDRAGNFVDIAPGDGFNSLEAHAFLDAFFGRRGALSLAARHTRRLTHDALVRIPDFPGQPIQPRAREQMVRRNRGDILQLDVTPRAALNEFFAVGGYYGLRRTGADRSILTFRVDAAPAPPNGIDDPGDPAMLDVGTAVTEHRIGAGFAYANVTAYRRGRARFPYELSYLHVETRRARGGPVPVLREDRVQVRVWLPVLRWF